MTVKKAVLYSGALNHSLFHLLGVLDGLQEGSSGLWSSSWTWTGRSFCMDAATAVLLLKLSKNIYQMVSRGG